MRILRVPEIEKKTGLSRWSIDRLEKAGDFPRRIPLGRRSIGWIEGQIDQWISDRVEAQLENDALEDDFEDSYEDESEEDDTDVRYFEDE